MKDDKFDLMFIFAILLIGIMLGWGITDVSWNQWSVDNGWAHYDMKTGKIVLHDQDFQDGFLKNILKELQGDLPDPELELNEPTI